jgi:NAD kinase
VTGAGFVFVQGRATGSFAIAVRTLRGLRLGTLSEYKAKPGTIQDQVSHHRNAWTKLLSLTVKQAQQRSQMRLEIDADQMIFELTSFQAAANIAFILGDQMTFLRAHRTSRERIADSISGR